MGNISKQITGHSHEQTVCILKAERCRPQQNRHESFPAFFKRIVLRANEIIGIK